tara:strand:+ start:439 stop:840 length:402 start_codon:yes stop_codon:yes gene_type:complete
MYIRKDNIVTSTIRKHINKDQPLVPSKHLITRWHNILNNEIFNNRIHPFKKIEIKRKQGCYAEHIGEEDDKYLYGTLSITNLFSNKSYFIFTLAHEMVHQWQWMHLYKTDHGQTFMKWKEQLNKFEIPLGVTI